MQQCFEGGASNAFKRAHVSIKKTILGVVETDWDAAQGSDWGVDEAVLRRVHKSWTDEQLRTILQELKCLVVAFENMSSDEREGVPRTLGEITANTAALVQIARLAIGRLSTT